MSTSQTSQTSQAPFWTLEFYDEKKGYHTDTIVTENEVEARLLSYIFRKEGQPHRIKPGEFHTAKRAVTGGVLPNGENYVNWEALNEARKSVGMSICASCEAWTITEHYLCDECVVSQAT